MKKITIKLLDDDAFEKLSATEADGANLEDSVGFANVRTGRIFVRDSRLEDKPVRDILNGYLIKHELDHLFEDEASDVDPLVPHVRHLKFKDILGSLLQVATPFTFAIPGIGPLGATALSAGLGAGGSALRGGDTGNILKGGVGGGVSGFLGAAAASPQAVPAGAVANQGSFLQYALPPGATAPIAGTSFLQSTLPSGALSTLPGAGASFLERLKGLSGESLGEKFGNIIPNVKSFGKNVLSAFGAKNAFAGTTQPSAYLSPSASKASSTGAQAGTGGSGITQALQSSTGTGGAEPQGILDRFGLGGNKGLLALGGLSLATGLGKGFPQVPELPQSVSDIRSRIQAGGSPLSQFAQSRLQEQLGQNFSPLSSLEIDAGLRQFRQQREQQRKGITDLYRNLGRTDPTTDSALRRDLSRFDEESATLESEFVANRTREAEQIFNNQRLSQIQTALGANTEEMQTLLQLAQLDVSQIMAQLDLDAEQARLFKETFLNLGSGLISSGFDTGTSFEDVLAALATRGA